MSSIDTASQQPTKKKSKKRRKGKKSADGALGVSEGGTINKVPEVHMSIGVGSWIRLQLFKSIQRARLPHCILHSI